MRKLTAAAALALALTAGTAATGPSASAGEGHHGKVTICHAAGLDGTTKYVTLELAYEAVYGQAGHFSEPGTPNAGHEDDYEGPCKPEPTTTTTPPTTVPEVTTTVPDTTTTAPPLVCTGDPATDPSGCPIDDCALPPGNRPPECDEPTPPPTDPPTTPPTAGPPTDEIAYGGANSGLLAAAGFSLIGLGLGLRRKFG